MLALCWACSYDYLLSDIQLIQSIYVLVCLTYFIWIFYSVALIAIHQLALSVSFVTISCFSLDQEKQRYVGTRLESGQDILCEQLILDSSCKILSLGFPSDASDSNLPRKVARRKVARGICITTRSVKQDSSNVLVVLPPKCKIIVSPVCLCLQSLKSQLINFLFFDATYFLHFSTTRTAGCNSSGASTEQHCSSMPSWNVSYFVSI